jgi:hypothetical protein
MITSELFPENGPPQINTTLTPFYPFPLSPEWEREAKGEGDGAVSLQPHVSHSRFQRFDNLSYRQLNWYKCISDRDISLGGKNESCCLL